MGWACSIVGDNMEYLCFNFDRQEYKKYSTLLSKTVYFSALAFIGILSSVGIGSVTLPLVGPFFGMLGLPFAIAFSLIIYRSRNRYRSDRKITQEYELASIQQTPTLDRGYFARARNSFPVVAFIAFLVILGFFIASYFVYDFRHSIWQDSGLWVEPTQKIKALNEKKTLFGISTILLIPIVIALWFWSSQNKKIILFLRKFRQDDINLAVQLAVRKKPFHQYRLLTLYDGAFSSTTSSPRAKISATTITILAAALLAATIGIVNVYVEGGLKGFAQAEGLIKSSVLQYFLLPVIYLYPEYILDEAIKIKDDLRYVADMYYDELEMYSFLIIGFSTLYYGVGVFFSILGSIYILAMLRLRMVRHFYVKTDGDLESLSNHVQKLKRPLFSPTIASPPAGIIDVEDSIWKEAVITLANNVDVVLFDLSDFSENIRWEIEQMLNLYRDKTVFIAQQSNFNDWAKIPANQNEQKTKDLIKRLLNENPITYTTPQTLSIPSLANKLAEKTRAIR